MGTFNVSLKTLTDRVSMEVVYTPRALDEISVEIAEVNRPGLFLAGYYDYFDKLRLQIMGLAEMNFLSGLTAEKRYEALEQLFRQQILSVAEVIRIDNLSVQIDKRLRKCRVKFKARRSSSVAARSWRPSRRCRNWRRSTRLPCCVPTRLPAL